MCVRFLRDMNLDAVYVTSHTCHYCHSCGPASLAICFALAMPCYTTKCEVRAAK